VTSVELSFAFSDRAKDIQQRVRAFAQSEVGPAEALFSEQVAQGGDRWKVVPVMEQLKKKARALGLWNLFLPDSERGGGLTNVEYAPIAEVCGYYPMLAEAMNCSAPDTGNMETLERYGSKELQQK
jgi:acyl-CoA dehydrogenase